MRSRGAAVRRWSTATRQRQQPGGSRDSARSPGGRRMLQKMTKRIWCTRNWHVEIKLAAIDQNECGGCKNGF